MTPTGQVGKDGQQSIFASYVSPFIQNIGKLFSSIGGSTDGSSQKENSDRYVEGEPLILGLTDKNQLSDDMTLRENKTKINKFEAERSSHLPPLGKQLTEIPVDQKRMSVQPSLNRAISLPAQKNKRLPPPPARKVFPVEEFMLLSQPGNEEVYFDLYNDADLPMLDKSTSVGRMVSKNIVQSSLDDDVMTDDEMISCANKVLNREVEKAIKQFCNGLDRHFVKNLLPRTD